MPSLRKRVLPSGKIHWDIRYYLDGKRKYFTIGETDRRTADKIFHQFCAKFAEDRESVMPREGDEVIGGKGLDLLGLAELAKDYASTNKSPKTSVREQGALKSIMSVMGNVSVSELSAERIEQYKKIRLQQASPHTVNIEIRVLNTCLNQAKNLGRISDAPKSNYKQLRTSAPEPPAFLTTEQVNILLSHPEPEYRSFMMVALYTGCRRNEILGLEWQDVDLPRRQIVVRGEIGKMGRRRTIPMNDVLHEMFVKWPADRQGLLFPNYKSDSVSQKFRRWVRQLGLPREIHLHSLRATFACHLIEKGVDIYVVSRLLGHSSVKVTEKHYLSLDPRHVQSAVNQLNFGNGGSG